MGKYPNRGKRQFTEREKRAFSAGKGYAAAKAGKRVACKTEKEKESFRNGVNAVRGKGHKNTHTRAKPKKNFNGEYRNQKSAIVAGITADGELVRLQ